MDRIEFAGKAKALLGKYKYAALILGIGIFLMLLPEEGQQPIQQEAPVPQIQQTTMAEEWEAILSQISGVGKVKVMLTEAAGAETVYQTDEDCSASSGSENLRVETVIITDGSRSESGLVRTVVPPVYLGAIIVCQGGDSPAIRLAVVEAVSNVTGIGSDRITVVKMK